MVEPALTCTTRFKSDPTDSSMTRKDSRIPFVCENASAPASSPDARVYPRRSADGDEGPHLRDVAVGADRRACSEVSTSLRDVTCSPQRRLFAIPFTVSASHCNRA